MRGLIARVLALPDGVRAAILYAGAMGWAKALTMLTLPLMTAMLAPAEYGRLELLASAAEIGGLITGAGLVDTLYRFATAPGADARVIGARVSGLALAIAAAGIVVVACLASSIAALMPLPTPTRDILLLGVAVALEPVLGVPLGWLRMHRRAGTYAAFAILRATLQSGLVALLVATGFGTSGVLLAGSITCLVVGFALGALQWRETRISVAPRASLSLLRYGVPLVGGGLASFVLGTADRWLLVGSVTPAALGQYALAVKIAAIVALLAQPFELWWYPQRLRFVSTPEGLARSSRVVTAGAAALIVAGTLTACAAPWLIALMAPRSYAPAAPMVPFLVLALVLQLMSSMANAGCYARRSGAQAMAVNAAAAVVALVFYLLLIPRWGVAGAIAATVAAQAFRFVVYATLSQRTVPLAWPVGRLLLLSAAAVGTGAASQFVGTGVQAALLDGAGLLVTALFGLVTVGRVPWPSRLGLGIRVAAS